MAGILWIACDRNMPTDPVDPVIPVDTMDMVDTVVVMPIDTVFLELKEKWSGDYIGDLHIEQTDLTGLITYDTVFNALYNIELLRDSIRPEYIEMKLRLQSYPVNTWAPLLFEEEEFLMDTIGKKDLLSSCTSWYWLHRESMTTGLEQKCDYRSLGGNLIITRGRFIMM